MTKQERINKLIKAQQLYTYEQWYAIVGTMYTHGNISRSPEADYEQYVNEKLKEYAE